MKSAKPVLFGIAILLSLANPQESSAQVSLAPAESGVVGSSSHSGLSGCTSCPTGSQSETTVCGCGNCQPGCLDKCPRPVRRLLDRCHCPDCGHQFQTAQDYCEFKVSESKEERTCYKTEQKTVCIPPITFPWQKCGPVRCAKTRTVLVLKTHKYECPVCKYSWEVKKAEPAVPVVEPPVPSTGQAGIVIAVPTVQPVINQ